MRSWPLLVLAAPAAAEVWSGWIGIAQKTGFGLVRPLPGIWPSLHLDTAITLPIGVEAYAAYALRAWLASQDSVSDRTRRFARWSAICSFLLGMAGQVTYHLLAQAGAAKAPWAITTIVSCLPVLVLAMGTTLAHMLRADSATAGTSPGRISGPAADRSPEGQDRSRPNPGGHPGAPTVPGPPPAIRTPRLPDQGAEPGTRVPRPRPGQSKRDQGRLIAGRLAAAGKPISRRTLRSHGVRGSNEALNALARRLNAKQAATLPARTVPRSRRPPPAAPNPILNSST